MPTLRTFSFSTQEHNAAQRKQGHYARLWSWCDNPIGKLKHRVAARKDPGIVAVYAQGPADLRFTRMREPKDV